MVPVRLPSAAGWINGCSGGSPWDGWMDACTLWMPQLGCVPRRMITPERGRTGIWATRFCRFVAVDSQSRDPHSICQVELCLSCLMLYSSRPRPGVGGDRAQSWHQLCALSPALWSFPPSPNHMPSHCIGILASPNHPPLQRVR